MIWLAPVLSGLLLVYNSYATAAPAQATKIRTTAANTSSNFRAISSRLSSPQRAFLLYLLPKVHAVNQTIAAQRRRLLTLQRKFSHSIPVRQSNLHWLKHIASYYGLRNPDFYTLQTWNTLRSRVNTVPADLVLAQSINESAWGRSRFAREGNNYFGQWCFYRGCGLVPKQRTVGRTNEVKKFPSAIASVASYIHNLNTNPAYASLRNIRQSLTKRKKPVTGNALAQGLLHYSTQREAYVQTIRNIINQYQLEKLAAQYQPPPAQK